MKKFLKITGIVVALFLALLFVLPFAFQGKIKTVALQEVNKMLNANVYMEDLSLSFFKHFPNASVTVDNFGIAGKDSFAGDTLADVKKLCVVVDVKSLFSDSYVINRVELNDANIYGKVLENGQTNWDIMPTDTTATSTTDTTSSNLKLDLALEKLLLSNVNVKYDDMQSGINAAVDTINLDLAGALSGDFSNIEAVKGSIDDMQLNIASVAYKDSTNEAHVKGLDFEFSGNYEDAIAKLKTNLVVNSVSYAMSGVNLVSNTKIVAGVNADANLDSMKVTLTEDSVMINDIKAKFEGFAQYVDSTTYKMDLKLNTSTITFKEILSLIPAVYSKDFASIKTNGKVSLKAFAKGTLKTNEDVLPNFDLQLNVADAMFKYPDLPKQVDHINILAEVSNPGGKMDQTVVNVSKFAMVMANNPFEAHLLLKTPISDPDFDCGVKGTIDFNTIKDVVNIDGTDLSGILTANVNAKGKDSYVEKEQYDNFTVAGNLNVKDMNVKSKDLSHAVQVMLANLDFTNKELKLTDLSVKIGNNDIEAKGSLKNFVAYALGKGTIVGTLDVLSNYINVEDILGIDTTASTSTSDTTSTSSSSVIEIPGDIDFTMSLGMKKLLYSGIEINNIKAGMRVADKVAKITNFSANTMDGTLKMNAAYNTQNVKKPTVDATMDVNSMSIPKVFSLVETANAYAPILAKATGNFNMSMSLNSDIDETLSPVLNTVNAKGKFSTKNIGLANIDILNKLSDAVKYSALKDPKVKNLNVNFVIKDGRMKTEPFNVSMGTTNMNVSGSTGLDETIDYKAAMSVPNSISTKTNIPLNANVLIGGTYTKPTFKVDASSVKDAAKAVVKENVTKVVNKALDEAKKQQEKIMSEANQQAEKLKAEAKKQGEKLVSEAQTESDKLVAKAKNPIEKAAAKKSGEKLVKEAKKKSDKLNSEADKKASSIISAAQEKSDKLIKEAEAKSTVK